MRSAGRASAGCECGALNAPRLCVCFFLLIRRRVRMSSAACAQPRHLAASFSDLLSPVPESQACLTSLTIELEPYLHQLLPAAITCVVGRKLCSSHDQDHWTLRALAARVVYTIARRYGERFADLQVCTATEPIIGKTDNPPWRLQKHNSHCHKQRRT